MTMLATTPDELDAAALGIKVDLSGLEAEGPVAAEGPAAEPEIAPEIDEPIPEEPEEPEAAPAEKGAVLEALEGMEPELAEPDPSGRRRIVLFARSRILPTITIRLKPSKDEGEDEQTLLEDTEPLPPEHPAPKEPEDDSEVFDDEELEALKRELGGKTLRTVGPEPEAASPEPTPTSISLNGVDLAAMAQGDEAPVYGIGRGSIVLLEGDGQSSTEVAQALAAGMLSHGRSVTYVSTSQDLPTLVGGMQDRGHDMAAPLKDLRFMIIPVYPLIEGRSADRDQLLEKLMSAPQLYNSDMLVVDALSSFLDEAMSGSDSLKIWPFLRKLASADKLVVLTMARDHRALGTMRPAVEAQLVARAESGHSKVEVVKAPLDSPEKIHLMKFRLSPDGAFELLD